jgi:hypothetical protein
MEMNISNVKKILVKDIVHYKKEDGKNRDFVSRHLFVVDDKGEYFELTLMADSKDDLKIIKSKESYLSDGDRNMIRDIKEVSK